MPKRNPQKSHHEWVEINLATIRRLGQVEKEKEDVERENKKLREDKLDRENEIKALKEENSALKRRVQDLEVKNESAEEFSREKPQKIIVSGDSHLKSISQGKLINTTGKTIEFLRTYCSRDDWPWAWKPDVSIASVLLQQVHSRATHLVMTSPTSDITNLGKLDPEIRLHWIDLSAKTIISTAEMCLIRFPALKSVTILEHLPRCDSKELNSLRLIANDLIRKEANISIMRSQISVAFNEMEPSSPAEVYQLFGCKGQRGHDGIHLRGPQGPDQLFGTLTRVISSL